MVLSTPRCRYPRDRKKLMRSMSASSKETGSNMKDIMSKISDKEQAKYTSSSESGKEISKMVNQMVMEYIIVTKLTKLRKGIGKMGN
jgi:hypothetical protein